MKTVLTLPSRVARAAIALLTFAGLVATTIGSVYVGLHAISPDLAPRDKLGATIKHIAVEHGVSYVEYRRRMAYAGDDSQSISALGDMIFIRVTLSGYKDRSYVMVTSMLDESGRALSMLERESVIYSTCENRSPQANEDGVSWRCWMRTPPPGKRYRFRAELYDGGLVRDLHDGPTYFGSLLDFMETEQFSSP